ncbi:Trk system potassium transporter TrkA [bacterium]|nr:Trk system potassium transporter TrkA [bacterium]
MKVVVLGAGSVGYDTTRQLIEEGKDVVLIEQNGERAKYAASHLDCLVIHDSGNSFAVLQRAGIEDADFFIAVTNSDEVNMVSCALAAQCSKPKKIARVRNMNYGRATFEGAPFLGADYVISPEVEAARQIIRTIDHGALSDVLSFENSSVRVQSFVVEKNSLFAKTTPLKIRMKIEGVFLIIALFRNDDVIIPRGDTQILPGDRLFVATDEKMMHKIFKKMHRNVKPIKRVVVAGAGTIGRLVIDHLLRHKYDVTLIEKNSDASKEMSEKHPDLLVLTGDIRDETMFTDEQLMKQDLFLSTTGNQEINMLTAIYAKIIGIPSVIALVHKANYLTIAQKLKVDATISPKVSSVDAIIKYIRKGHIRAFYSLFDGKAEIIEFGISAGNELIGTKLREIEMPRKSLIISISRAGRDLIPDGSTEIQVADDIIVIALRADVHKIETLFATLL